MTDEFGAEYPALTRGALTVSQLNRAVSGVLDRSFPSVWVRGEITNFTRAASGHWYFSLKDSAAQVRCVMFRGRNQLAGFNPREGDEIEARCNVGLYEPRGDFQLNVEFIRRSGLGQLYEEFLRLKNRLQAEGLFDAAGRRALPRLPMRIGIVTSPQAAALRDVLATLARRAPYAALVLYPVPVQGAGAGERIAAMLATASARAEVEVLLLVRGGGSIEDLWAFNEEVVARAIRAGRIPVVVGVGHESDVTIADFAADLRAPTPTAAAELVAPAVEDLLASLNALADRSRRVIRQRWQAATQRLDYAARALQTPRAPIAALEARVGGLQARAVGALERSFACARLR
ncbi:MAG: exodeoxyribonuclease VII large subunit, partial [Burkholderiaceae bacterium]